MDQPTIGCRVDELDTPCLLLDLDAFERNISRMSEYCRSNGVAWRPHAKGHKSKSIARRLVEAGAIGMTCAKLGEAEVMADAGVRDLLIANPLAGPIKMRRLVELARRADPIVLVDHFDHVTALSAAARTGGVSIRVLIEIDVGLRRVGVAPGEPVVQLAQAIAARPGLRCAGIMGYEGHLLTVADPVEKRRRIADTMRLLADSRELLARAGLPCPIVSVAGTGSFQITAEMPGITEIQAGGGMFMDLFYRTKCQVSDLDYALTILATVTSRPTADRAVMDAGRKTMNMELCMPEVQGRPDLRLKSLSAEHGVIEVSPPGPSPAIGDRLTLIPGYADLTTVLHDRLFACRRGVVEAIWPLEARGRLD
jgi:D-serine deaminase-like pyridoxal phosphate-dependent protein